MSNQVAFCAECHRTVLVPYRDNHAGMSYYCEKHLPKETNDKPTTTKE